MGLKIPIIEPKKKALVEITKEIGIPLIGHIAFGIIERAGNNIIQVRCTTICNMNCQFCSTDGGPFSTKHPTNYILDINYLLGWVKEVAEFKGDNLQIFLDSVGDSLTHPDFVKLVDGLRKIRQIRDIIVITNGTYKYSRKMKEAEKITYWKFYRKIEELEKRYDMKLRFQNEEFNVEKRKRIPVDFKVGDKVNVEIVAPGWFSNQMIGKARNRCISINNCNHELGKSVKVKIIENNNNIYIAERINNN